MDKTHNAHLDELIHNELLPIQQMFHSYEQIADNQTFHFSPKIFRKCALNIQKVIDVARQLTTKE